MRRPRNKSNKVVDDYTGAVTYANRVKKDRYGFYSEDPDKYNPQENVRGYGDPFPAKIILPLGPMPFELPYVPEFIGNTTVPTPLSGPGSYLLQAPGIDEMTIGFDFIVR